jgi:Fic family protein
MATLIENRAGKFVQQKGGYSTFIPESLPPRDYRDLLADENLQLALSNAAAALARLDGVTQVLPNPDLFVAMYVKKEALLSSQIEGTQASLQGVLEFEAKMKSRENINEIQEVINYIKAMNFGLEKVKASTISVDLINEIHKTLITGTRGEQVLPGELRTIQNWLGVKGASILDASYIPPPPELVEPLTKDLMGFINTKIKMPPLVKIALIHAHFETIHPYLDGNGRMGRLLITFYLCSIGNLSRPLMYLSFYLKKNREKYYESLNNIRKNGDWESWLYFFLKGVVEVSNNSIETAKKIIQLKTDVTKKLIENHISGGNAIKLIELLFNRPFITTKIVSEELEISGQAATILLSKFEKVGIVAEITGKQRYKEYIFIDYMRIIQEGTQIK